MCLAGLHDDRRRRDRRRVYGPEVEHRATSLLRLPSGAGRWPHRRFGPVGLAPPSAGINVFVH